MRQSRADQSSRHTQMTDIPLDLEALHRMRRRSWVHWAERYLRYRADAEEAAPGATARAGRRTGRGGDRVAAEVSGVDLARQALVVAREQAKKNDAATKKKPKRRAR